MPSAAYSGTPLAKKLGIVAGRRVVVLEAHLTYDTESILISADSAAYQAMDDGTYEAWDCLNDWYRGSVVTFWDFIDSLHLVLDGVFHTGLVATQYAALPGVLYAGVNNIGYIGGYVPAGICGNVAGDTYHLWFDHGTEGPGSGVHYFTSGPGEAPILVGHWAGDSSARPDWVDDYLACSWEPAPPPP